MSTHASTACRSPSLTWFHLQSRSWRATHTPQGALRQTYSHVFLDEFQDATRNQYQFVETAFLGTNAKLTAVGDVKQRIMAWAGALDGIMKTFAEDFGAASLPLYQNFRSAPPHLRRMQNRMIANMDPAAASPDEDLLGEEGVIQVLHYDSQIEEAGALVDLIDGWLKDGIPAKRDSSLGPPTVQAGNEKRLRRNSTISGIPFRNEQDSQDLAAEPVAALIFNFMWVVAGEPNPEAYTELMRVASRPSASDEAALQFDSPAQTSTPGRANSGPRPHFREWRPRWMVASHHRVLGRRIATSTQRLVAGLPTRHPTR